MTTRQSFWIGQLKQREDRGLPGGTTKSFCAWRKKAGPEDRFQPKFQDFGFGKEVVFFRDRQNLSSLNMALRNLGDGLRLKAESEEQNEEGNSTQESVLSLKE